MDSILNATPEELNAMIATSKGYEWREQRPGHWYCLMHPNDYRFGLWKKVSKPEKVVNFTHLVFVPDWSRSIESAWELVKDLPHFKLIRIGETWQCTAYSCSPLDHPMTNCGCIIADGNTPQEAICKAWLLVRGNGSQD